MFVLFLVSSDIDVVEVIVAALALVRAVTARVVVGIVVVVLVGTSSKL